MSVIGRRVGRYDEAEHLVNSMLVADGQVPYKDLRTQYPELETAARGSVCLGYRGLRDQQAETLLPSWERGQIGPSGAFGS